MICEAPPKFVCQCDGPGHCAVFDRTQSKRMWDICRGAVLTPEKSEAYRENWRRMKGMSPAQMQAAIKTGPGTELEALIAKLGGKPCDTCKAWAAQMNLWGVDGCREHRAAIVEKIVQAAFETWITDQARIGWSMSREPWFRVSDPVGSLVDEAIRLAEVSANAPPLPSP